ncbi:MAG: XrtA system polysaccharide deacetylase [Pseudomonadota bacterium]
MTSEPVTVPVRRAADGRIINAMSVDVEDFFQVGAFENTIKRGDWDAYDLRVERNTDRLLALFAQEGVSATFFSLGWVAERCPALIRRIVDQGHELASHGYDHKRVTSLTPESFRADLRKSKAILEDVSGSEIRGYRAPSFSIGEQNLWALEVLADEGYAYSSSVFPIKHDHYGMPDAPRRAFRPGGGKMVEIPMTTTQLGGRTIACSGGGYFRLLPYGVSKRLFDRVNGTDGAAIMFYLHPWEIDTQQPRQDGAPLLSRFRHYVNLNAMYGKLHKTLKDYHWDRVDRVFLEDQSSDVKNAA